MTTTERSHYENLGRKAFADGRNAIPLSDPAIAAAIDGMAVGTGAADIMRAWTKGWTAANLAAPVN